VQDRDPAIVRLDPAVAACRLAVRRALADLPGGSRVLIACSGGADSLALAAAALWRRSRPGPQVGLICVDHRLQDGSTERAAAVAAWAAGEGAEPAEVIAVTVGIAGGPEAAARAARYAALDAAAQRHGAAAVLLGHTADDQAETVLLGLARGSGARSLAGMPARRGVYRRPLLDLTRATTRAACAVLGLPVWEDPHNTDPAYARARVRSAALPALESALGPGVAAALARTAAQLRDDADALDAWADQASAAARRDGDSLDLPVLDISSVTDLPAAVRRRVLRSAAHRAGVPAGRLSARHIAAMDALIRHWHGQGAVALPAGYAALRDSRQKYGVLRFITPEER
jgi:tRNA(Ile)-lysidine synthase